MAQMAGQLGRRAAHAMVQRHQRAPLDMGDLFIGEDRLQADAGELVHALGQIPDRAFGIEGIRRIGCHIAAMAMIA